MRRPVVLIVIVAVALGLAVSAGLLFGVILPRFERDPESGPTFAPGELTPEESTVTAVPQPDGTVRVDQVLIFDIAPGLEDRPAIWYLDGIQIGWKSSERTAQYGVIPKGPATNVNFADRRPCGEGDRLTYHPHDAEQREAVVVTSPAGVTAAPIPVTEKTR